MEAILLGLVLIVCIYILYSIFTKETFVDFLPQEENRLGKVATHILTPLNSDKIGNNPTGLVATVARPISTAAASSIQNTYETALGNPNAGPRIDDTTSLLYLVDFCYQRGKTTNPFSDATFAQNCGMCMTSGSLLDGTGFSGSNGTGVVVYSEDKTYSLSQGIDAAPSSHSATCGPMVKLAGTHSNVTSLAINQDQYTATKAYMTSNAYTIVQGMGAGENTIRCTATSNGHPYVIKAGFSRDGAWDTHIAGSVDYTRKNLLTTTSINDSCIEQPSCTIPSTYQQWDISALCGYPKPTAITDLRIDDTKTTSTSLTFLWDGGLYADTYDFTLRNTANGSTVPGTSASLNATSKTVSYKELRPATQYKFTLLIKNAAGTAPGSYMEGLAGSTGYVMGTTLDDRIPMTNIRFTGVSKTGFTVGWDGADNATHINLLLTGGGSQLTNDVPGSSKSHVYTDLSPGTTYTFSASVSYVTPGVLSTGSLTQATLAAPVAVATPPPRPRQEGAVITSAQWVNGSIQSGGSVDLSWIPPVPTSGAIINYRIYVSANPTTDATTVPLTPVEAIRFPNTSVRINAPSNKPYISVWTFISAIGIVESAYVQITEDPQAAERAAQAAAQESAQRAAQEAAQAAAEQAARAAQEAAQRAAQAADRAAQKASIRNDRIAGSMKTVYGPQNLPGNQAHSLNGPSLMTQDDTVTYTLGPVGFIETTLGGNRNVDWWIGPDPVRLSNGALNPSFKGFTLPRGNPLRLNTSSLAPGSTTITGAINGFGILSMDIAVLPRE